MGKPWEKPVIYKANVMWKWYGMFYSSSKRTATDNVANPMPLNPVIVNHTTCKWDVIIIWLVG
jgi:hypothetical protein